jgi:hypothetical protein
MNIGDFLKALALDAWYKITLSFASAVLAVSFFTEVKGVTNAQLQLLSGGLFLISLGEWKNHKTVSGFKPPNAYTGPAAFMSGTIRSTDAFGILLQAVGVALLLAGDLGNLALMITARRVALL